MAHYIFIEGKDVTGDITNFDEFTLEVGYNSNKAIVNKLSETFRFDSDTETYKMLQKVFYSDCNGFENELKGLFKSDICGGIIVPLTITVEDGSFSSEYIEVLMKSDDIDEAAYLKFESTYWFDDEFPAAYDIPIMYFATQPTYIIWLIVLFTTSIRIFLNTIDSILNGICKFILFGKDCNIGISRFAFSDLDNWLTGVGRWATAPLVRQILEYHFTGAGISFQSSILNDPESPYYNMAFFDLTRGEKGSYKDTSREKRIQVMMGNSYLMTVMELVKRMADLFEAEYRIIDGTLYIEMPEFFNELRNTNIHRASKCTRYEYDINEMYAYGEFSFAEDGVDREGNKTLSYYRQKLEWNNPPRLSQKGKLQRYHSFAPGRFMFDHVGFRKDGFFDFERLIDEFRDGPESFIEGFYHNEGIIRKQDLVLTDDMTSIPKLLILEDDFDVNDAKVIRKEIGTIKQKKYYLYNYPLMYKETNDSIVNDVLVPGQEGAMTGYAKTANPRLKKDMMLIREETVDCGCYVVENIISNFHRVYMDTDFGKGYPESAVIRFQKGKITVTFNDIKVVCR